MLSHINRAEAIGGASAALGVLVAFLPWYGYGTGNAHITDNAFRASVLGDLFFIAIAAVILLLLIGRGFVDDVVTPYIPETTAYAVAAAVAMGSVLVQMILARAAGRSLGAGIFLALIAAAGLCSAAVIRRLHPDRRRIVRDSRSHEALLTP
jgi:p-aminobenzoyl-glutamate transporter AbgT